MTVKELAREISKEKYDQKNLPVIIQMPNGDTYDVSMVSKYDDMTVIDAVPRDVKIREVE